MTKRLRVPAFDEIKKDFNCSDFSEFYDYVRTEFIQQNVYPSRPKAPTILSGKDLFNVDKLDKYRADVVEYNNQKKEFDDNVMTYRENNSAIFNLVKDGIIHFADGVDYIPEHYLEGVWNLAWEDAHAHGFEEVYYKFNSIVETIFKNV